MPLAAAVFSTVLFPLDQSRAALDTIATVLKLVQQLCVGELEKKGCARRRGMSRGWSLRILRT